MGICKRECKKHADPGFTFQTSDGLLLLETVYHIVRTAIRNIAGRRVLLLYFYRRDRVVSGSYEPEYILYQCRDDYITLQRLEDGKLKWREAMASNLEARYPSLIRTCAFYRQRDEQLVTRFCGNSEKTGFDALNALQESIVAQRLKKRIEARERKIVRRMEPIPSIPRGLKGWVHREVLPQYIFYQYIRGNKPKPGYCTACGHDVMVPDAKHNATGNCPRCGKSITFKASGRATNVWDRATVQVLQKLDSGELALRVFKIFRSLRAWRGAGMSLWESSRFFIKYDAEKKMEFEPYYFSYDTGILTHWKQGYRPRFSYWQYSFEGDFCGHLFWRNLDDVLKGTPWQYCQIEQFYRSNWEPLEVIPYFSVFQRYPFIEYLVKLGLYRLASCIVYGRDASRVINPEGKTPREILGIGLEDIPALRQVDATADQLDLYRALKARGIKPDDVLLRWYEDTECGDKDSILVPLRFTTPHKLMGYIDRQFEQLKDVVVSFNYRRYENPGRVLSEYKDYLRLGRGLGYDLKNNFVLFPRNLQRAHELAAGRFDKRKTEIYEKTIREAYEGLARQYGLRKYGFAMIPPKTGKEIVAEGHTLHHCVGNYIDRIAKEKCVILFLRRADDMDSPFYTVELRDGRIVQARGMGNCAPTPQVERFLALWEQKKLGDVPVPAAA